MTPTDHDAPLQKHSHPASSGAEQGQEVTLTIDELAAACRIEPTWVIERVRAGLIEIDNHGDPARWRFADLHLTRIRCMVSMERDMDANPELAALVADLIGELRELRAALASRRG